MINKYNFVCPFCGNEDYIGKWNVLKLKCKHCGETVVVRFSDVPTRIIKF